jgi:hypothetical protein
MRGFGKFTVQAIQSQPFQAAIGCAMTISGVNLQELLARITNDPPWYLTNHLTQIVVIFLGVLVLAYVFWHQAEAERANHERPDVSAVEAFKMMLFQSRRGTELVRRRQELLNIPLQYERFLT